MGFYQLPSFQALCTAEIASRVEQNAENGRHQTSESTKWLDSDEQARLNQAKKDWHLSLDEYDREKQSYTDALLDFASASSALSVISRLQPELAPFYRQVTSEAEVS